ncbi:cation:proton antiporter subunit C [Thermotoga sp. KOL6]|uniref:cation:proton antiporter subunit C n=1 Tax=Thermotoga sp. KOL6 TaxID=126741 RepID=UPI000C75D834|nr:cation:proton antiporter subunit C [Thermotoga sp. KOL6]PLV59841.1 NADH-ubiquinone oxidoreductase subunit 4L [Thermotoga sp. KOL6]
MLEQLSLTIVLIGLLGIFINKDLIKKIISLDIMGTGVVSFFVVASRKQGKEVPIPFHEGTTDPIPQALIITSIVIGFATISLLVTIASVISAKYSSLSSDKLDKNQGGEET